MASKPLQRYIILAPLLVSVFLFSGCIDDLIELSEIGDDGVPINYEYLGEKEVIVPADWSTCQIAVDNNLGQVTVQTADDVSDYLLKASIAVYGRNGKGSVDEANTLTYNAVTEDTVRAEFTSAWIEPIQNNPYTYGLEISVSKDISLELSIDVSTGAITVALTDVTIAALVLDTSTGRIDLELSEVDFSATTAKIDTSTGQVKVDLVDINYELSQTSWEISASTGQIRCTLHQTIPDQGARNFKIDTSTGGITVATTLPNEYGIKVEVDTTFGDISIFGHDTKTYTSSNYGTAATQYEFNLETSTGQITVH